MSDWQPIETARTDGGRMILLILHEGKKTVVIGGYDPHWTGNGWVYDSPRIKAGSVPLKWQHLPEPPKDTPND